LAVVVAVGLAVAPPERSQVSIETHQVQLAAVVVTAVDNSSVLGANEASLAPVSAQVSAQVSAPASAPVHDEGRAILPAAAEAEDNFWDTPLGTVLLGVNFLLMPLWFLATPFTLPLSMFFAAPQVTMDGPFGTLQFLIATGLGFISGPISLLAPFVQNPASAAAAEAPGTGRSGLAGEAPNQTGSAPSAKAAVAEDDFGSAPVRNESESTEKRSRVRLVERQIGAEPRAAATQATGASPVTEERVAGDSRREVNDGEAAVPVTAADPAPSSAVEGPSPTSRAPKSRAKSRSLR
jgi:hypothetical protein